MSNLLTDDELQEIQHSARMTEERHIQFNRAEDVPKLLAHIAAQAAQIAALEQASKPDAFDHQAIMMRACAARFSTPEAIQANDEWSDE